MPKFHVVIAAASAAAFINLSAVQAHEDGHRQHGAHEHGTGQLHIALDGRELAIELIIPADDIVGFEHAPADDKEKKILADAVKALQDPVRVVELPAEAACTLASVEVGSELLEEGHADDHAQGGEEEHEEHAEFEVNYSYLCTAPQSLRYADVRLFKSFPHAKRIKAEVAGIGKQTAKTLTPRAARLEF